jgi:hypothetical protein
MPPPFRKVLGRVRIGVDHCVPESMTKNPRGRTTGGLPKGPRPTFLDGRLIVGIPVHLVT